MKKGLGLLTSLTALGLVACSPGPWEDYFSVSETDLVVKSAAPRPLQAFPWQTLRSPIRLL